MHCEKCGSADTEVTKCSKCGQKSLIRCNNCSYQVCADKYCEVISIKRKIKILTYFAMLLVLMMVVILPVVVMRVMEGEETPAPTPRPTQVAVATRPPPPPPPTVVAPPPPDPAKVLRERRTKASTAAKKLAAENVGYAKGSSDPTQGGVDFVGLVVYSLGQAGVEVPRNPGTILGMGERITERSKLEPGDVMVFSKKAGENRPNFLGVYVGDGKFACSYPSGQRAGVLTVELSHKFWDPRFLFGVRILRQE